MLGHCLTIVMILCLSKYSALNIHIHQEEVDTGDKGNTDDSVDSDDVDLNLLPVVCKEYSRLVKRFRAPTSNFPIFRPRFRNILEKLRFGHLEFIHAQYSEQRKHI